MMNKPNLSIHTDNEQLAHSVSNQSFKNQRLMEKTAFTTTSAIFSLTLSVFTLSALYQGMQNFPNNSSKIWSLKN